MDAETEDCIASSSSGGDDAAGEGETTPPREGCRRRMRPQGQHEQEAFINSKEEASIPPIHPLQEEQDPGEAPPMPIRTCRICFGTSAEEGSGRMISPCKCKGTMRHVHVECLNAWRNAGQGGKSFYQCDQCGFQYNLKRTYWAGVLGQAWVATAVTGVLFLATAFLAGFVVKGAVALWNHPSLNSMLSGGLDNADGDDDLYAEDEWRAVFDLRGIFADLHIFDTIHSFWSIDWTHFFSGILGIGLLGASQVFFSFVFHNPFGNARLVRRRGGGGGVAGGGEAFGAILLAVVVLVGVGKAFYSIYGTVNDFTKRRLISLENAILEVEED